jgi:signal transduction histidine kinase
VGAAFLRLRALLVGPALVVLSAVLWASGEARPRAVAATLSLGAMLAFFAAEAVAFRRRDITEGYLLASMLVTQAGIGLVGATTGGVTSPVVPLLLAPTGVGLAAFGTLPSGRIVMGGLVLSVVGIAVGGAALAWAPLASPLRELMTVAACLMCGALLYLAIGRLSDAYVSAGSALARTQNSLLEEATLRAQDLEAVGARVAHELKNPLTAAKGLVELVRRHCDESQSERLDVAASELDRVQATLQGYLAFSRPLSPLQLAPFDVEPWLTDLVAAHEGLARTTRVNLSLHFRRTNPGTQTEPDWLGDRARLTDAVGNLLGNALQACQPGDDVEVHCELDAQHLRLEVRDTGEGMAADALARIGTPFVTTRETGTGLGVVLARATLVQHAGKLRYESTPGSGTRAQVELPRLSEPERPRP